MVLFIFNLLGGKKQTKELEKSIAVLPFLNDSPDEENSYFINGLMDEILINLQKIKDLRIISRNSVEQYRGTAKPSTHEIAKKLGVNYIVEGSGQKYGNKFRLRIQLIEAATDKHLWAESYEREIKETIDIFGIQSQVAQIIATELNAVITPEEKQLIEKKPTTNLTAYENLRIFNQRQREPFWIVSLIKTDPLFDSLRNEPEFQQIVSDMEAKYQAEHERVRKWLEEQGT